MSKLSIIVATDKNGLIGDDGKLPWHIPWDLKYFKEKTLGKNIIMGRKTYESIGRALPNRTNVVLTTNDNYRANNCIVVNHIDEVIKLSSESNADTFVIGGSQIYKQFIDHIEDMYINQIQSECEGDSYFPDYDETKWNVIKEYIVETTENEKRYKIKVKHLSRFKE